MRTKKIILIALVFALCLPLWAFSPMRTVMARMNDQQIEMLLSGDYEEASTIFEQSTGAIMPENTIMQDLAFRTENLENAFSVALSSFVPYPDSMKDMTEQQKYLSVFNMAQAISTIKGITYLSHRSGDKPEVLFSDAYLVVDKNNKKKTSDPVSDSVTQQFTRYAWLKDSRFGGNLYQINYYCYYDEIFLEICNVNPIKYMGFKCLDANALRLYLDAELTEEGVIVSGLAVIYNQEPSVRVLFTTVDLPSAFMKRICSLKDWFCGKITEK